MDLKAYLLERKERVDRALDAFLPDDGQKGGIVEAMRYSLFAGGKRLRPILCMAGAEAVGGDPQKVMFCACALEMVHTYSLIHDDLPAMDDDDLRRGLPTNHKVFGEGMAVLAGDGLLTEAMVLLSDKNRSEGLKPERVLNAAHTVMKHSGFQGMVGGQVLDLLAEKKTPELSMVDMIHLKKTAALIKASVESGAILGGGASDQVAKLSEYGLKIGLAFQIADDILDLVGESAELGKKTGADLAKGKMTYPAAVGLEQARKRGGELTKEACGLLTDFGDNAEPLSELASYIMERTH